MLARFTVSSSTVAEKLGLSQDARQLSGKRRGRIWDRTLPGLIRTRPWTLVALAVTLLYLLSRPSSPPEASLGGEKRTDLVCNPYDQPGYFDWHEDQPHKGKWTTFESQAGDEGSAPGCPDAPDWIATMTTAGEHIGDRPPPAPPAGEADPYSEARQKWKRKDKAVEDLWWLQNKTVLIIGDSVDRNTMDHLGFFAKSDVWPTSYHDASVIGKPEGWDIRGVPHVVHLRHLDSQVSNVFMYGADEENTFKHQVDWHAPGKAEDRLYDLFVPFTHQLKHPVGFIQYHSGMWDAALLGRQDAQRGRSTDSAIDEQRIRWWMQRQRSIISAIKEAYPGVPIWFRTLHRVGTQVGKGSEDYIVGVERAFDGKRQNFFTDLRCGQIREMQIAIARELCLPVNDFGRWWEGYQMFQDKVHPLPLPGGLVMVNPLLHSIYLEAIGRDRWEIKPCPVGWHVDDQMMLDMSA